MFYRYLLPLVYLVDRKRPLSLPHPSNNYIPIYYGVVAPGGARCYWVCPYTSGLERALILGGYGMESWKRLSTLNWYEQDISKARRGSGERNAVWASPEKLPQRSIWTLSKPLLLPPWVAVGLIQVIQVIMDHI